ncbi:hypothetical protein [Caballeronia sp. LZ028]|uniref:hypothetical protein n=1 Tax=Caballeronia sp. LZ028 TaxID=3038563 RepID=UPI00285DCD97|nr:hypothetical protein [Caballeronia sp. LZ028]MDR5769672.1 hypothetical protein [Caballeronia sp. LZ028]
MQAFDVADTGFDIGWDFARFGRALDRASSEPGYWPDTGQVVSIFAFRSIAPINSCPNGCKFGLTHFDAAGFSTTM